MGEVTAARVERAVPCILPVARPATGMGLPTTSQPVLAGHRGPQPSPTASPRHPHVLPTALFSLTQPLPFFKKKTNKQSKPNPEVQEE